MSIDGLYPVLAQAAEGAGEGARELAKLRGITLLPIAAMVLTLLTTAILAAVIVLIVRARSQSKERLISLAIQHNQPEVAREIVGRRSLWILWIVLGLVAIVVADQLHNIWALLAVAILAVATAPAWLPSLTGARDGKKDRKQEKAPYMPPSPPAVAPPSGGSGGEELKPQEPESRAKSSGASSTMSSWLLLF